MPFYVSFELENTIVQSSEAESTVNGFLENFGANQETGPGG